MYSKKFYAYDSIINVSYQISIEVRFDWHSSRGAVINVDNLLAKESQGRRKDIRKSIAIWREQLCKKDN